MEDHLYNPPPLSLSCPSDSAQVRVPTPDPSFLVGCANETQRRSCSVREGETGNCHRVGRLGWPSSSIGGGWHCGAKHQVQR